MQVSNLVVEGTNRGPLTAKRLVDILSACLLLPVVLSLSAVTAAIVYVCLGRPLVFRQQRAGRDMRTFDVIKFRTMTDVRDEDGELLPDEQRQTAVTAMLRRLRLDELPQLLCVLRGDMSMVGPRPLPRDTLMRFGEIGELRCKVSPGVTGWAQVNGNTRLSDEEKIALDIWYVDRKNLALDFSILGMTVATILRGERVDVRNLQRALLHLRQRRALLTDRIPTHGD
ncbi:sugar transferase [Rhizobium sp. TRM95111]|uniref:sugar transferase n=1 Tax=Rhizobium alarense TaxID=2846851 RepID=UPI001F3EDB3B|nr:sugar transferase [Rhizobium alarense]MCF3641817.1 sugar transferase [Rhizobium alarense]